MSPAACQNRRRVLSRPMNGGPSVLPGRPDRRVALLRLGGLEEGDRSGADDAHLAAGLGVDEGDEPALKVDVAPAQALVAVAAVLHRVPDELGPAKAGQGQDAHGQHDGRMNRHAPPWSILPSPCARRSRWPVALGIVERRASARISSAVNARRSPSSLKRSTWRAGLVPGGTSSARSASRRRPRAPSTSGSLRPASASGPGGALAPGRRSGRAPARRRASAPHAALGAPRGGVAGALAALGARLGALVEVLEVARDGILDGHRVAAVLLALLLRVETAGHQPRRSCAIARACSSVIAP